MDGGMGSIIMIVVMFAVLYFLLIRPQQKQQKAVRQMQQSLSKGDKIVTIGGLHGEIDSIDESKVVIKTSENNRLTFDRRAIRELADKG
ncbi:preprotein translocase subunit YajC [Bacillus safensis]|uniref:Preprotein translocase subunit YajC n=6 Tax=Bacillus TaxID=1386 RepID=A0A0M2EG36_BACIA|nr:MULTISPECIES: preprotein translocase subunit YajC [Bacillus]MBW4849275.1 preprotein translocase subunit YajC [Bacillaceae bacterium]MBY0190326.1 preprotein translocase subunit YajC [Bacillus aerophilus]PNU24027.1 preprotein translocase subunit YajC [Bacillus stratosphericus]AIZ60993.1 preprotein translocase subunit YajC [Bacillus sp. WP8]AOZ89869.1 preprotein translocase subunit YajC [Bacillus xiamenensis]